MKPYLLCLLALLTAPTSAANRLLGQVDPAFSSAEFSLRVLWVRKLEGRFEYIQGAVSEAARPGYFDVDVKIAAQSLAMRNPEHAEWAQSEEFFDAEQHPWIQFRADNASESLLNEGGELVGLLSLRGVTRPASFQLLPSDCPRPAIDCPLEARGELHRSDFGMNARRWAVSDKVKLAFSIRLRSSADAGG